MIEPIGDGPRWSSIPNEVQLVVDQAGDLAWRLDLQGDWNRGAPVRETLNRFVRLRNGSDPDILAFAQKRGVLGICDHGDPGTHAGCAPLRLESDRGWFTEPLAQWRTWIAKVSSALIINRSIRQGEVGLSSEWDSLIRGQRDGEAFTRSTRFVEPDGREVPFEEWESSHARWFFAERVTSWIQRAAIYPRFTWPDSYEHGELTVVRAGPLAPYMRPSHGQPGWIGHYPWPQTSLFPVLIAQLVDALRSDLPAATCSVCQLPYQPESVKGKEPRKPRYDRHNFCSNECRHRRRKETERNSKRRSRSRKIQRTEEMEAEATVSNVESGPKNGNT